MNTRIARLILKHASDLSPEQQQSLIEGLERELHRHGERAFNAGRVPQGLILGVVPSGVKYKDYADWTENTKNLPVSRSTGKE